MFKFLKKKLREKKNSNELVFFVKKSMVSIGAYTYGYKHLNIIEYGNGTNLRIGKFTSISAGVKVFLDYGGHDITNISTYPFHELYNEVFKVKKNTYQNRRNKGDVVIGNDVWIGLDVLILNGVKIGDGAVIGANSVITKDVKPYEFVSGNPARHIRYRFSEDIIKLLIKLQWWDLNEDKISEVVRILNAKPDKKILINLVKKYR